MLRSDEVGGRSGRSSMGGVSQVARSFKWHGSLLTKTPRRFLSLVSRLLASPSPALLA